MQPRTVVKNTIGEPVVVELSAFRVVRLGQGTTASALKFVYASHNSDDFCMLVP
jgi:hypothetical protein